MTRAVLARLPELGGQPISLTIRDNLTVVIGGRDTGLPVHAAADLTRRRILLDRELLASPREFERILIHELAHFAWRRLGNPRRWSFEALVAGEIKAHARGELGWSAESRKAGLTGKDIAHRSRRWRGYLCESFCDTAAWYFGSARGHAEFTLAARHQRRRANWFRDLGRGSQRIAL